jgi:hypothetical protein
MVAELEHISINLKKYLPVFKQPRHRKADAHAADFCRAWHKLATERTGNPLYTQGAAFYSLVFRKVTEASFTELCRRARKANRSS